jgi:HD-GYP domain-containing protein (c-di-GMP phosphodiesterase class II)
MQIMRESRGTHFDPAILDAFIVAFGRAEHSA